jgi:hypothetical protein
LLDVVQELGAAAGLAGVVGLAVLCALHVSQARDLKRLRDWAGRAPERSGPRPVIPVDAPGPSRPQQPAMSPPQRSQPDRRRIGERHVAVALVGLLLVLGGATTYGVIQLTDGDGAGTAGKAQANSNNNGVASKPGRDDVAIEPGTVTVAVLNGTSVPHLAATLRDRLAAAGFVKGMINDFSDQQLTASVVQYAPGRQAEANAVGRTIGIIRRQPITAESRTLAGDATVIVIAGADQAP